MAPPRSTPRTEGLASEIPTYHGGEFVTPLTGTSSEQGRTPLPTLRLVAFDFSNTSDPSPTHHFSTLEAVLPPPGLSQIVPHVLETIDGEDMDTPLENTIYTHVWTSINLTKVFIFLQIQLMSCVYASFLLCVFPF
jgi:hypothetical protein